MRDWKTLVSGAVALGALVGVASLFETDEGASKHKSNCQHKKSNRIVHSDINTTKYSYRESIERFEEHMRSQGFKNMHNSRRTRTQISETWFNHKTGTTVIGHFHIN